MNIIFSRFYYDLGGRYINWKFMFAINGWKSLLKWKTEINLQNSYKDIE